MGFTQSLLQDLQNYDPVAIIITVIVMVAVLVGSFFLGKIIYKPFKVKKEKNDIVKLSALEDLKRKGIMNTVTKKDKKQLIKKAKKQLRKAERDHKLTKDYSELNKKFSETE